MSKPRLIAFYLPQFYPTKENDEWWQKGFTEWTNVGNAKPLFRGHYQPKVPADLGYYDLRVPEVREEQAQMAREAGIEGFCYWHYWFAGRRLLDRVFTEVVESGKPNYPFCLCWANHSWYQKTWDPTKPNKLLIEQTYPGEQDYIDHFYAMLPAFRDERYMKIDGRNIFCIYSSLDIPDFPLFKNLWNKLACENGLKGFYFIGFTFNEIDVPSILDKEYDAVLIDYTLKSVKSRNLLSQYFIRFKRRIGIPHLLKYNTYIDIVLNSYKCSNNVHPCIIPNFDHSPRSKTRGTIIPDSTPKKWGALCKKIFSITSSRDSEENIVFIKAWNEWGEGNYLEPDLKYGKEYLEELSDALNKR
jgi:hypothetical protein